MKSLVRILVITICGCALGCRGEASSEGKILRVVFWRPSKGTPPEAIQESEKAFRSFPSKAPIVERFEWGRIEHDDHLSHILLVTFKDPPSAFDRTYDTALREAAGEYVRVGLDTHAFLLHDATPRVRISVQGKVRRVILIRLNPKTSREELETVEKAMVALPGEIPAISRLEWGAQIAYDPSTAKPIDPDYRNGSYCLLLTFNDTGEHDACLSHSAFKEFERLVEQYQIKGMGRGSYGWKFAAQVERVAP